MFGRTRAPAAFAIVTLLFLTLVPVGLAAASPSTAAGLAINAREVRETLAHLPLSFVPNVGQFAEPTSFAGFTPGAMLQFERGAVTYHFRRPLPEPTRDAVSGKEGRPAGLPRFESLTVRATFPGANPRAFLRGEAPQEQRCSFYLGNDPGRWRANVPSFGAVRYHDLYPGIDLAYHGNSRELEYDFIVRPGASPRRIRIRYQGVERIAVNPRGDLEVTTRFGRTLEAAPVAYQTIRGERRPVRARYRVIDPATFGFAIDDPLDPTAPLVIDPVLKYSTYLGGISYDEVHDIAVDAAGSAYVVGGTLSPDFPASGSPIPNPNYSVFVTKLAPNGASLVYSVFIGGSETQLGYGLTLDAAGNAYIAGITGANDFPTTSGAYDVTFNGSNPGEADMFVCKLSPSAALLYSSYFGGSTTDWGGRMALDAQGRLFVLCQTGSNDFPTTAGAYDVSFNGANDIGVSAFKLAGAGAADLVYSTYLGGGSNDEAYDLVIDNAGDVYVGGSTSSANFPATGGPPFNSTFDAVVVKLHPVAAGAADLVFGTKLGGVGQDYGGSVAVDGAGNVVFSGITSSANYGPVSGYQTTYGGGSYDGFVAKFLANGTTLVYNTFLGSTGVDRCGDVVLDPSWNAVVVGSTSSPTFPTTSGTYDNSFNGATDIFITAFDPGGSLLESTFLGGSDPDIPYAFTIDNGGRWYVTGNTQSSDYPFTPGAYDSTLGGGPIDVVVTTFNTRGPDTCQACVSPPDTCCAKAPPLTLAERPSLSPNVLVTTRQPTPAYPYSVTLYDLGSPLPSPLEDEEWSAITRYSGPAGTWNEDSLGTVFGLTLDEYGNIFVTHTSCYAVDKVAKVFGAAPGAVYRIDGQTGRITTFCVLPNLPDPNVPPGENLPGLGNITYDCRHKQFFVTNLEDGRIYRITPNGVNGSTGTVQQTFDPLGFDNGLPGWAPLGQRLWGVQWHKDRVYYAVWAEDIGAPNAAVANEIRSVALLPNGAIDTSVGSDRHELYLPPIGTGALMGIFSMPVSDISFSAGGKMLLGERGITNQTVPQAHLSRVLEYACLGACWQPANLYAIGHASPDNAAGGVDYDADPFAGSTLGRVWASGDALHNGSPYPDVTYGFQGLRPNGGSILNSMIVDSDGNVAGGEKTSLGDIEAPGCPDSSVGTVCGVKWLDLDHDGIKDQGEPVLAGWTVALSGTAGTFTATTNAQGAYCVYNVPAGTYTLYEIGQAGWVQTAPAGGTYTVTLAGGQIVTGKDFGNYPSGVSSGCVMPPPGMAAWWPFREAPTATQSADVTHLNPVKNTLQLLGGTAITTSGVVGNDLCLGSELDYAVAPNANQSGLSFGAGPFAIDAWVKPALSGGGSPRVIVEKRVLISPTPYRTRGWALYMNGLQCMLEVGIGISTQILPGPTLTAGSWSHVAVSVSRSPAQGRWYLNGAPQPSLDFVPTPGGTQSNADLYVGMPSPPFGFSPGLQACIDELEIFDTALPAQSVAELYASGAAGKCPEYCRVPQVVTLCKDKDSVKVCLSICNNNPTSQSYHWSLAGLPAGNCTTNGPTVFVPPAGAVSVPPNGCVSVCVTLPRPPGLTAHGATSCYAFTFVNDATGATYTCQGTIRADNSCWCVQPVQQGIVNVPATLGPGLIGIPIDIEIGRPCGGTSVLAYRVRAEFGPSSHEDPHELSLNGLPPGEPVIGEGTVDQGHTENVTVYVSYPNGYDLMGHYEIRLEADTDGDGTYEDLCGTRVASVPDSAMEVGAPDGPRFLDSVRLLASPNPFSGGSAIAFSLALPSDVTLRIYDVGGRVVRTVHGGRLLAGPHRFEWDGRDAGRRAVPAGIYFIRLDSSRLRLDAKLVKLR